MAAIALTAFALVTKAAPATVAPTASAAVRSADGQVASSAAAPLASPDGGGIAAASSGIDVPPALNPNASPYPPLAGVPLRPGSLQRIQVGGAPVTVSFSLPAGWQQGSDAMYLRTDVTPVPLSIGAWRIRHVNTFPCRWSAGVYADVSSVDRAEGEAQALSSWWGQDPGSTTPLTNSDIAPLANNPVPTTLLGYPAWYVEVLIPTGLDLAACDGGQLVLWDASPGNARYALGPSEVNRIWVVDVDRGPIVIDAGLSLRASASQKAELQAIVDSIRLES